jgi:hypothetical protein
MGVLDSAGGRMNESRPDDVILVRPPPVSADGTIITDVYCRSCGYNLRGLQGDPVRCPECGGLTDLALALLPAWAIRRAISQMENMPAYCLLFAFLSLSTAFLAWIKHNDGAAFFAICAVGCVMIWGYYVRQCRNAFQRRGWFVIMLWFHSALLLCTLWWFLLVLQELGLSSRPDVPYSVSAIGTVASIGCGIVCYRRGRAAILQTQRAEAVRIGQECLRSQWTTSERTVTVLGSSSLPAPTVLRCNTTAAPDRCKRRARW